MKWVRTLKRDDLVKNKTLHSVWMCLWRNKEMQNDSVWNIFTDETWTVLSVSGRPCYCKASATWRISTLTVMYTEHCFVKREKSISAALLDILCLCVLTAGLGAQRRMHYLWRECMRFSQVSRCWKEAHATCPSPSMVPAAPHPTTALFLCSVNPVERELLHMHRSQYVQTHPLGGSSRV